MMPRPDPLENPIRPVAETIPAVTVCSRPKGLPIATTQSPTFTRAGVTHFCERQRLGNVDLQDGEVVLPILTDDAGNIAVSARQLDVDLVSARHHVVVRQDVALAVNDNARTQAADPSFARCVGTEEPIEEVFAEEILEGFRIRLLLAARV